MLKSIALMLNLKVVRMKAVKKSVASQIRDALRRDAFRIEPLEPRVLLSADPIFAPALVALSPDRSDIQSMSEAYAAALVNSSPSISVPILARLLSYPKINTSSQNFAVDAVFFDMGEMELQSGFMDASLRVAANEVLAGSGTLDVSLFNGGIVSPGYSPGVQTITGDYTQAANGTLLIEIGGDTAGTGGGFYDQINISGLAVLDGTLAVDLWGGYKPKDGQVFNVMNFGSATGKFDIGTGLLKTNDGVFFEVTQGSTSLTLTAHTIDPSHFGHWMQMPQRRSRWCCGLHLHRSTSSTSTSWSIGNGRPRWQATAGPSA